MSGVLEANSAMKLLIVEVLTEGQEVGNYAFRMVWHERILAEEKKM